MIVDSRPLPAHKPGDRIDSKRLNAFEAKAITDITVGPGLTLVRRGNAVAIGRTRDNTRPSAAWIVVDLEFDAGDGTVATPYTYTAFREGSEEPIGESLTPEFNRWPINYNAAVLGIGDFGGADGAFRLLFAKEAPITTPACEA